MRCDHPLPYIISIYFVFKTVFVMCLLYSVRYIEFLLLSIAHGWFLVETMKNSTQLTNSVCICNNTQCRMANHNNEHLVSKEADKIRRLVTYETKQSWLLAKTANANNTMNKIKHELSALAGNERTLNFCCFHNLFFVLSLFQILFVFDCAKHDSNSIRLN